MEVNHNVVDICLKFHSTSTTAARDAGFIN